MIRCFFAFLFLLLCCAGCMSFDYVGQSFDPRPDSSPVAFFEGRQEIPPDTYRIIGRGTLTGSSEIDGFDRKQKMRDIARERGADAVCIVGTQTLPVGFYPRAKGEFAPPSTINANRDGTNDVGEPWQSDSFGEESVSSSGENRARYNFEIKLLLLKKTGDFEKEMKTRKGFL